MRKFSSLNESVHINTDKVESILSEYKDFSYKLYDYYCNDNLNLYSDIKNIDDKSHNAKLILIKINESIKQSARIDNWDSISTFDSSEFYFYRNNEELKKYYLQIFDILENLKEYSPKLCLKNGYFLILLIGEKVSNRDIELKNDINNAYNKLYTMISDVCRSNITGVKFTVSFFRQSNHLYLNFNKAATSKYEMSLLASLCKYMTGDGYNWIKDVEKIKEFDDIAEEIHDMGFCIKFKEKYDNYTLTIYEP